MRKKRRASPPQVTLGGKIGRAIWRKYILPLLRDRTLSTWAIGDQLGVTAMTVSRWRRGYVR